MAASSVTFGVSAQAADLRGSVWRWPIRSRTEFSTSAAATVTRPTASLPIFNRRRTRTGTPTGSGHSGVSRYAATKSWGWRWETRPDCAGEEILDVLAEFTGDKWVSIEFGLQSIHQVSLDWLKRGHDFHCFEESVERARERGLHVGAHLMLGLPCETSRQMIQTAKAMARLQVDSVKLHNLYVVRNTPLADRWKAGEFQLPQRNEYVRMVVDFLEYLSPDCVVDRIAGDAPPQFLLAPDWCQDKAIPSAGRRVRNLIGAALGRDLGGCLQVDSQGQKGDNLW